MTWTCNRCDTPRSDDDVYCPKCGSCGECLCCPCGKPGCEWCEQAGQDTDEDEEVAAEDDYETVLPVTNLEDKVRRIQPQLSCSRCPPNRGENRDHGVDYRHMRNDGPHQVKRTRNRKAERSAKPVLLGRAGLPVDQLAPPSAQNSEQENDQ